MFCALRLSDSVWCTLHGSVFNLILLLLLACHSKAVFSDPGRYLFDSTESRWRQGERKDTWVDLCDVCLLSRYGASSWHGHRLLRPSLAVVSDERAGESNLRTFFWRVARSLVQNFTATCQEVSKVLKLLTKTEIHSDFQPKKSLETLCRLFLTMRSFCCGIQRDIE